MAVRICVSEVPVWKDNWLVVPSITEFTQSSHGGHTSHGLLLASGWSGTLGRVHSWETGGFATRWPWPKDSLWPYQIFIELHCSFRLPHLTFLPPFCPLPGSDLHCSLKAPNIYSSPFPCALPGFPLNKSLTQLIPTWLLRGLRLIQSVHWSSCFHNYTPTLYTAARRNQVKSNSSPLALGSTRSGPCFTHRYHFLSAHSASAAQTSWLFLTL